MKILTALIHEYFIQHPRPSQIIFYNENLFLILYHDVYCHSYPVFSISESESKRDFLKGDVEWMLISLCSKVLIIKDMFLSRYLLYATLCHKIPKSSWRKNRLTVLKIYQQFTPALSLLCEFENRLISVRMYVATKIFCSFCFSSINIKAIKCKTNV